MSDFEDYLKWRGDLPFEQVPMNEVDAYLISILGTPDLSGIVPDDGVGITLKEAYSKYYERKDINPDYLGRLFPPIISKNLRVAAKTERFSELILSDYFQKYNEEENEQISAITIKIPDGPYVIAFRGTDDTLVGWKEDILMGVRNEIASQRDASSYLKKIADKTKGPLMIMGHSKGGNLSVYAGIMAEKSIRDRIVKIYNFDGPGFRKDFWESENAQEMKNKTLTYISQNTLVGALLTHGGKVKICSCKKTGPIAHELMYWDLVGPKFTRARALSVQSTRFGELFNRQMNKMTDEEIERFVEDLFAALRSTGAVTITDIGAKSPLENYHIIKELYKKSSVKHMAKDIAVLFKELITEKTKKEKTK